MSLLIRDNILPPVFSRFAKSGSSHHAELLTRWNQRLAQSMCTYRSLLEHRLHHMALRRHTCNRDTSRKQNMFFNSVDKVESCSLQGSFQVLGRLCDHIWHHTASGESVPAIQTLFWNHNWKLRTLFLQKYIHTRTRGRMILAGSD